MSTTQCASAYTSILSCAKQCLLIKRLRSEWRVSCCWRESQQQRQQRLGIVAAASTAVVAVSIGPGERFAELLCITLCCCWAEHSSLRQQQWLHIGWDNGKSLPDIPWQQSIQRADILINHTDCLSGNYRQCLIRLRSFSANCLTAPIVTSKVSGW